MKETMKRLFEVFLICHFLISMMIGGCGLILGKDHVLGYADMFNPAIMALLCTFPTLLTIRSEKLTMAQLVLRKFFQVIIIEGIILSMHLGADGIHNAKELIVVAASVLLVFIGVLVIDWASGYMEAEELNRRLVQMQNARKETK